MVEDVSFPLKYRKESHQGENKYQKYHDDSNDATD